MSRDADQPENTIFAGSTTPPRSAVLEPGAAVAGRYVIERELGRGGIGVVYLARDRQLHDKPVVLKALLDTTRGNEWLQRKFRQEVEALARIDHPGVVGVLDAGDLGDGTSYFVMQYVDGTPLREAMTRDGMPAERVASIMSQLGRALAAAHERGIFHRDLKPENVMLQRLAGGDEQVKVIDFGVAHIKDSVVAPEAATSVAVGTVIYMAPEQLTAKPVSAATDVYALGVVAYEMLTGRRPFVPETMFRLLELQRAGLRAAPSTLRPELSPAVDEVILRALAFDPQERYASAREFADDLSRALAGGAVTRRVAADSSARLDPPPTALGDLQGQPTALPPEAGTREHRDRATVPATAAAPTEMPETAVTPPREVTAPTRPLPEAAAAAPEPPERRSPLPWVGAALAVAVVAVGAIWYGARPEPAPGPTNAPTNEAAPPPAAGAQRELRFSLAVQKTRDGRPFEEPFQATGREIFEGGYRFWMNVASADAGYLYVVNEGPEPRGGLPSYNFLHPTFSGDSAAIAADQPVSVPPRDTGGFQFDEERGTERMWIVWGKEPVPELEAAKRFANPDDRGVISDPAVAAALRDLLARGGPATAEVVGEGAGRQLRIRGEGDVVVVLQPLEHQ